MQAVAVLPDDLAALPPGPGLAAVLGSVALSVVPNDRMLDVLAAQQRQLSHEQARMAATLAELGRCSGDLEPGRPARLAALDRYAPDETRAALRWTRTAAEFEHDLAETVVHAMPALFTAWLAGTLDRPRVLVFHRYLTDLAPAQVTAICRTAVPRAPKLTTHPGMGAERGTGEDGERRGPEHRQVVGHLRPVDLRRRVLQDGESRRVIRGHAEPDLPGVPDRGGEVGEGLAERVAPTSGGRSREPALDAMRSEPAT